MALSPTISAPRTSITQAATFAAAHNSFAAEQVPEWRPRRRVAALAKSTLWNSCGLRAVRRRLVAPEWAVLLRPRRQWRRKIGLAVRPLAALILNDCARGWLDPEREARAATASRVYRPVRRAVTRGSPGRPECPRAREADAATGLRRGRRHGADGRAFCSSLCVCVSTEKWPPSFVATVTPAGARGALHAPARAQRNTRLASQIGPRQHSPRATRIDVRSAIGVVANDKTFG